MLMELVLRISRIPTENQTTACYRSEHIALVEVQKAFALGVLRSHRSLRSNISSSHRPGWLF
jgi:hypothetical protein